MSEWVSERTYTLTHNCTWRVLKAIRNKFYFGRNNKCRSIQPSPTFCLLYSSLVITTTKRISKRITHTINIVFISISIAIFLFPHSFCSFSLSGERSLIRYFFTHIECVFVLYSIHIYYTPNLSIFFALRCKVYVLFGVTIFFIDVRCTVYSVLECVCLWHVL